MLEIVYTLKITIYDKTQNKYQDFIRTETYTVERDIQDIYGNSYTLKDGNILDFFKTEIDTYIIENFLYSRDSIDVETYEVVSNTNGVQVYFSNPEGNNIFTLTPNLVAYIEKPHIVVELPEQFTGLPFDDAAIKWQWTIDNTNTYAHYILDSNNKILAQIPIGLNYYIESGLEYNTPYVRKLVRYTGEHNSAISLPVTVMTNEKSSVPTTLRKYIIKSRDEYSDEDYSSSIERLPVFQSGIGHGVDLLVSKNDKDITHIPFTLTGYLYGVRRYHDLVYVPVEFDYNFEANGEVPEIHKEGHIRFVLSAYEINAINIKSVGTIYRPMPIKWRIGAIVEYDYIDPQVFQDLINYTNNYYEQMYNGGV